MGIKIVRSLIFIYNLNLSLNKFIIFNLQKYRTGKGPVYLSNLPRKVFYDIYLQKTHEGP